MKGNNKKVYHNYIINKKLGPNIPYKSKITKSPYNLLEFI